MAEPDGRHSAKRRALPAHGVHERRADRSLHIADTNTLSGAVKTRAELLVVIPDDELWTTAEWHGLAQLPGRPGFVRRARGDRIAPELSRSPWRRNGWRVLRKLTMPASGMVNSKRPSSGFDEGQRALLRSQSLICPNAEGIVDWEVAGDRYCALQRGTMRTYGAIAIALAVAGVGVAVYSLSRDVPQNEAAKGLQWLWQAFSGMVALLAATPIPKVLAAKEKVTRWLNILQGLRASQGTPEHEQWVKRAMEAVA